jgi:AcrR family transcriptional regulator
MGRTAKFTPEQFVDAALELVAAHGPIAVTMSAVAGRLSAPIGSVYHRFASRDALLARLWLQIVQSFQKGFLDALRHEGGLEAALHTPRWVRAHPKEAKLLLVYRREELISGPWPEEIQSFAASVARELDAGIRQFARQALGSGAKSALRRTQFALIDVPYAAVRRSLIAGEALPQEVDQMVSETYTAILGRNS